MHKRQTEIVCRFKRNSTECGQGSKQPIIMHNNPGPFDDDGSCVPRIDILVSLHSESLFTVIKVVGNHIYSTVFNVQKAS